MSVNKLKSKPLSDVKTVKLKYLDDTILFDKIDYTTSETFNFSFYNFLKSPNDIAVNNYSYFFLSKKGLFSDRVSYKQKENNIDVILTPLRFDYFDDSYFLYFESTSVSDSPFESNVFINAPILHDLAALNQQEITEENITEYSGYLFIIEFIPDTNKCYIKHNSNSKEYYLYNERFTGTADSYINADTVMFTTDKGMAEKFGKFTYIIDGDKISLSLVESDMVQVTVADMFITTTVPTYDKDSDSLINITEVTPVTIWVHNTHNIDKVSNTLRQAGSSKDRCIYYLSDEYVGKAFTINKKIRIRSLNGIAGQLTLVDNRTLSDNDELPPITFKKVSITLPSNSYINSAWLSYDSDSSLSINTDHSAFDQENQCIYHLQYNNINPVDYSTTVNIIPLKNHVSPNNNIIRGDNLYNNLNDRKPNTDFREYTSIETGGMREFGNETIVLSYTYYNEEFTVSPGSDFIFTIQKNNESLSGNNKFALYPYKQLNINNSQFINNGACGSDIPILADKVKKMQKNSAIFNNGRYLCTWLYQTPELKHGIWMDRYYYPDRISKKESYYGTIALNTEADIIDKDYIYKDGKWNDKINNALENVAYFDKQSDLVFEPGVTYTYSRIGEDNINAVLDKIKPFKVDTISNFESKDDSILVENNKLNATGAIDMSFDMFINPEKEYGPCILSNSLINGFSITDVDNITPFMYTFDTTIVYLHNLSGQIINSFDIKEFYPDTKDICNIAIEKPFKDIAVITTESVYLFSFDLMLKKRIKMDFLTLENINEWKNITYYPTSPVLSDNNLYLLLNKTITGGESMYDVGRVIHINVKTGTWSELNRYSKNTSRLLVTTKNNIPVHVGVNYTQSDSNITVNNNTKYPLPLTVPANNEILDINDNINYDINYWYFAPEFKPDITDVTIVNNAGAIKSLHLQDGKLYALPFVKIGRMQDSNLLYGVRQRSKTFSQLELIQLNWYELLNVDTGSTNIAFQSNDTFTHFAINDKEEFIICKKRNGDNIAMLFDSAKRPLRTINLQKLGYTEIFAVDTLKSYNDGKMQSTFACIGYHLDTNTNEHTTRLILISPAGMVTDIILSNTVSSAVPYLTNYHSVNTKYTNGLKFNLNVESRDGLIQEYSYLMDYTKLSTGWYSFRVLIDSNTNIFEVYCNNKLLPVRYSLDLSNIGDKHLFDNPILFGTLKYKRSTLLSEFLFENQNSYNTKNVKIRNINLYNKILTTAETQAISLAKSELQPVVITLPCGQKNNLEEIIRYFKFLPPTNVSNTISIDISHSGVSDISVQKQLSLDILNKINAELMLPVTIKEINFI